jgi:hypothetical protein
MPIRSRRTLGLPKSENSPTISYGRSGDLVTEFQKKIFFFPAPRSMYASRSRRRDISLRGENAAKG